MYKVRCTSCGHTFKVSHNDGRTKIQTKGTKHTPKSKAARIQRRTASKCDECNGETFAVHQVA